VITVLCGGVGGAKLVSGLAAVLEDPAELTVIVNTADDFEHLGLAISPDVDTVLYTLAGLASEERGWGIEGDTWTALEMLGRYGMPTWFRIGDRDLGTHLVRTAWLRAGWTPTAVTAALARGLGVRASVLPMSDARVRTVVHTPDGALPFQDYFVRRMARDAVTGIVFEGLDDARPSAEALDAIARSAVVIVAPSNPLVSIGPIVRLPGMDAALAGSSALRVAITPLIAGKAVKGPTVAMLAGLGLAADPADVARLYRGFLDVFVLDAVDRAAAERVAEAGGPPGRLAVECLDTLMADRAGRRRLALAVLDVAARRGAPVPAARR
jgi:LPPG:FO 2-phospho-L-lactate transferase